MIPCRYSYITQNSQIGAAIADLCDADEIGLDTEISGSFVKGGKRIYLKMEQQKLATLQLAAIDGGQQRCFIFDAFKVDVYLLKEYLEAEGTRFAIHNAQFDTKRLAYYYGINLKDVWCTLEAEKKIRGTGGNTLKECVSRYFNSSLSKEERDEDWGVRPISKEMLEYAARDAYAHLMLYRAQKAAGGRSAYVKPERLAAVNPMLPGMEALEGMDAKRQWLKEFIDSGQSYRFPSKWHAAGAPINIADTDAYAKHLLRWLDVIMRGNRGTALENMYANLDGCGWHSLDQACLDSIDELIGVVDHDIIPPLPDWKILEQAENARWKKGVDEHWWLKESLSFHGSQHPYTPPPAETEIGI